jgi:hypothetical protein
MQQSGAVNGRHASASLLEELDSRFSPLLGIGVLHQPLTQAAALGQFHGEQDERQSLVLAETGVIGLDDVGRVVDLFPQAELVEELLPGTFGFTLSHHDYLEGHLFIDDRIKDLVHGPEPALSQLFDNAIAIAEDFSLGEG